MDVFDGAMVGERIDGKLYYRGVVEWGFNAADASDWSGRR
jgi:hypothetical protein